jgi:threonine dehydrogenase-like Zn-dependent dehydrogenase
VPDPQRRHEREAIVRPLAVAACDLDWLMICGQTPFQFPIHLGHECVAEVVEGPDRFSSGERVVIPFQISCGTCERCRRGMTGDCAAVPPLSMCGFGALGGEWGGMLSDLALVPYAEAMLVPLPQDVDPAIVPSAADNMTDGWRAVAPALGKLPAADVLVVGGGGTRSIPLYAVDTALALGAASVTYVDTDPDRLAVAQQLGAKVVEGNPGRSLGAFPITVDGTGTPDGLVATLRLTDAEAVAAHVGCDHRLPVAARHRGHVEPDGNADELLIAPSADGHQPLRTRDPSRRPHHRGRRSPERRR